MEYLPQELRRALFETMTETLNHLDKDTFTNIQTAAAVSVAKIVEPVMRTPSVVVDCRQPFSS